MIHTKNLAGIWNLKLDENKMGIENKEWENVFNDTINLPSSTSLEKKGTPNKERETGFLTDAYKFEGYVWFSKEIEVEAEQASKAVFRTY